MVKKQMHSLPIDHGVKSNEIEKNALSSHLHTVVVMKCNKKCCSVTYILFIIG